MKNLIFSLIGLLAIPVSMVAFGPQTPLKAPIRPKNIIYILADDHRYVSWAK